MKVKVNDKSGFNKGAKGIVEFVEPSGNIIWVLREGADKPCWFSHIELDIDTGEK